MITSLFSFGCSVPPCLVCLAVHSSFLKCLRLDLVGAAPTVAYHIIKGQAHVRGADRCDHTETGKRESPFHNAIAFSKTNGRHHRGFQPLPFGAQKLAFVVGTAHATGS